MKVSSFLSPFLLLMGRSSLGGVSAASTAVGTIRGLLQEEEGSVSASDDRRHLGSSISTASTSAAHGTIRNLLHLQEEEESENESDHLGSSISTASTSTSAAHGTIRKLEEEEEDGTWETITFDRFERQWGNFRKKTNSHDAIRIVDEAENDYIPRGKAALLIRNNNGDKSSVYHHESHDVRVYDMFQLSFSFSMENMDNEDGFVVEVSTDNGKNYERVKRFSKSNYELEQVYNETVSLDDKLTNGNKEKVRIRFRCMGRRNKDRVYIDDVHFEGFKFYNRMIRGLQDNGDSTDNIFNHPQTSPSDFVTNADEFIAAFKDASTDSSNPSIIALAAGTTIAIENPDSSSIKEEGIDISAKHVQLICDGYNATNKCTVERRGSSQGRLFSAVQDSGAFSFAAWGIAFGGGNAVNGDLFYGGVFSVNCQDADCDLTCTDCDFVGNGALKGGGAIYMKGLGDTEVNLSFVGCNFESNSVVSNNEAEGGGAIYTVSESPTSTVNMDIHQCTFAENSVNGNGEGNDILGESKNNGDVVLFCADTITTGRVDDMVIDGVTQTCSDTAVPSSAPTNVPSVSLAPTGVPSTSVAPSVSTVPSSLPSDVPSGSPSTSPSVYPSVQPTFSMAPSGTPSMSPSHVGQWDTITSDDFEFSWGSYMRYTNEPDYCDNPKKSDGSLRSRDVCHNHHAIRKVREDSPKIPDGEASLMLRKKGDFYHVKAHDVKKCSNLRLKFKLYAIKMEVGDRLKVKLKDDELIKKYRLGDDGRFKNEQNYNVTIDFNTDTDVNVADLEEAQIQFKLDASAKAEELYIDDIDFECYVENAVQDGLWEDIISEKFERGWGNFENRNGLVRMSSLFIPQGQAAILFDSKYDKRMRLKELQDVRSYEKLRIVFSFSVMKGDSDLNIHEGNDWLEVRYKDSQAHDVKLRLSENEGKYRTDSVYKNVVLDFDDRIGNYSLIGDADIIFKTNAKTMLENSIFVDDIRFQGYKTIWVPADEL